MGGKTLRWGIAITTVLAIAVGVWALASRSKAERDLLGRLEQRVPFPSAGVEPCPTSSARRLVILVLGQSNAGNHGAEEQPTPSVASPAVMVSNGRACVLSRDPLPGATGRHRSLWTEVASSLRARSYQREIVFMPLAVDATTIDEWTRSSSRLHAALEQLLADSVAAGVQPDIVLWQQGEADAQRGTTTTAYAQGLQRLVSIIRGAGVDAPIVAALSTRCGRSGPSAEIRSAVAGVAATRSGIRIGPDTDALDESMRNHGCHFRVRGLRAAADLWASVLIDQMRSSKPAPPTVRRDTATRLGGTHVGAKLLGLNLTGTQLRSSLGSAIGLWMGCAAAHSA